MEEKVEFRSEKVFATLIAVSELLDVCGLSHAEQIEALAACIEARAKHIRLFCDVTEVENKEERLASILEEVLGAQRDEEEPDGEPEKENEEVPEEGADASH